MYTRGTYFVMSDFDPMTLGIVDDSAASGGLFDDAIESAPAAEAVEQTAPDGQLEAQTEEPDSAAPPADGVESVDTPPADAPVEPFSFGGREWKSRDEAEHSFKSWEGRIQAEQAKVRDYEARINEYWDYVQAVSRENDEFRKSSETPAPTGKEVPTAPSVDFDQIGRIMEIARNQGMDPVAVGMKAYAAQAEKVYEHKLNERLAAVEAPVTQMQDAAVENNADREMFLWAQELKDTTGNSAYPELQKDGLDENLVVNIHRTWKQLAREFGPQYAYSAPGFDYAYRLAKDLTPAANSGQQTAQAQPETVSQEVVRDAQGRFSNSAAEASSDLAGNQPNPVRARVPKTATQEMLEELTALKPVKIGTTELGFYE